jgi:hypothetical protein
MMGGLVGFGIGFVILWRVWFPGDVLSWFVVSLLPGFVAYRLMQVPPGWQAPRATGLFLGLWAALFCMPIVVYLARLIGVPG